MIVNFEQRGSEFTRHNYLRMKRWELITGELLKQVKSITEGSLKSNCHFNICYERMLTLSIICRLNITIEKL